MTSGEKKRYLKSYRAAVDSIEAREAEYVLWMARATRITPNLESTGGGCGVSDRVGDAVARAVDVAAGIEREIAELQERRCKIGREIMAVGDLTLSDLLYHVYIDGMSLDQTARRMNYSYGRICHLHGQALRRFRMEDDNDENTDARHLSV